MHRHVLSALAACLVVACEQPPGPITSPGQSHASHAAPRSSAAAGAEREVAQLRALTARFHQFETAAKAGWGTKITECLSNPGVGGMGYHYGNTTLIDGVVDAQQPELLLYEPQKNGKLRFVAVEYIVPFTAWTATEPPKLYGQSFHRNEGFGLWVLHVWHFRNNPSGIFMDWNPEVSCQFASR